MSPCRVAGGGDAPRLTTCLIGRTGANKKFRRGPDARHQGAWTDRQDPFENGAAPKKFRTAT
jgi:hypothetical protein